MNLLIINYLFIIKNLYLTDEIKDGVSTNKIDKLGYEYIRDNGKF